MGTGTCRSSRPGWRRDGRMTPSRRCFSIESGRSDSDTGRPAPPVKVERLSADYHVYPGATDRALRRYQAILEPPGLRPLYPQDAECSCRSCSFDDVRHAHDVLELVLDQLPSGLVPSLSAKWSLWTLCTSSALFPTRLSTAGSGALTFGRQSTRGPVPTFGSRPSRSIGRSAFWLSHGVTWQRRPGCPCA